MKVLIVNQHSNNFGDDAAGVAVVNNLLKNENITQIELLYCMPGTIPVMNERVIHNHELDVRKFNRREFLYYYFLRIKRGQFLPAFIEKIKEYDVVLVSPCGANLGIYKDWQLLFQDMLVVMRKKPLIFHLNTISPSKNRLFDFLVVRLCKKTSVYVREKASYDFLKGHGINVKLGTDSAFSLESKTKLQKNKKRIVFVPSDLWSWHVDFKDRHKEDFYKLILEPLGKFAKDKNMEICILPHTNKETEFKFNEEIKKYLSENYVGDKVEVAVINSAYEYEDYIRSANMVVGMRYHSIVFACKNQIPYLALAYEQKMKEVSSYSGQIEYYIDLKKLELPTVVEEKLSNIVEKHDEIEKELSERKEMLIEKSLMVIKEKFSEEV